MQKLNVQDLFESFERLAREADWSEEQIEEVKINDNEK